MASPRWARYPRTMARKLSLAVIFLATTLAGLVIVGLGALLVSHSSITWNELPPECVAPFEACVAESMAARRNTRTGRSTLPEEPDTCGRDARACREGWERDHGEPWVVGGCSGRASRAPAP